LALILAVDMAGTPSRWLMVEEAISYYARRMVAWSHGEVVATYHGGVSRKDRRAFPVVHPTQHHRHQGRSGLLQDYHAEPHLSNTSLFFRDRHMCAYCGGQYKERDLRATT